MESGNLYWITGLSGAGKTTIGIRLYQYLRQKKNNILFLDGDMLRKVYQSKAYSEKGRRSLAFQNARLCKMLTDQGIDVIICLIAMYEDCRKWNRENIENYHEIYLRVDLGELIRRDQKQLYSRALRNEITNVVGINMPFEEPQSPDLIIDNNGQNTPEEVVEMIIRFFQV